MPNYKTAAEIEQLKSDAKKHSRSGGKLPNAIIYLPNLTRSERWILTILASDANYEGDFLDWIAISKSVFAERCGYSDPKSIKAHEDALIKKGYLAKRSRFRADGGQDTCEYALTEKLFSDYEAWMIRQAIEKKCSVASFAYKRTGIYGATSPSEEYPEQGEIDSDMGLGKSAPGGHENHPSPTDAGYPLPPNENPPQGGVNSRPPLTGLLSGPNSDPLLVDVSAEEERANPASRINADLVEICKQVESALRFNDRFIKYDVTHRVISSLHSKHGISALHSWIAWLNDPKTPLPRNLGKLSWRDRLQYTWSAYESKDRVEEPVISEKQEVTDEEHQKWLDELKKISMPY